MSRESRLLLVIGVLSVGGVLLLVGMAQRYGGILAQQSQAQPDRRPPAAQPDLARAPMTALRQVDAFIAGRRAVRKALASSASSPATLADPELSRLRELRDAAIAEHDLGRYDYLHVRAVYRRWRDGQGRLDAGYAEALELRSEELAAVDLGSFERLDI